MGVLKSASVVKWDQRFESAFPQQRVMSSKKLTSALAGLRQRLLDREYA
jgi:hypothetical protein